MSEILLSQFLASTSASALYIFLVIHSLSSDGRVNFPFKDVVDSFCLLTFARRFDLNLSLPFLTVNYS